MGDCCVMRSAFVAAIKALESSDQMEACDIRLENFTSLIYILCMTVESAE
jgi:hypothetical protein